MTLALVRSYKPITFAIVLVSCCLLAQLGMAQPAPASQANGDTVYQQLRQQSEGADAFSGQVATVNGLVLRRDAAIFKFNGQFYFLPPIEGRVVGAVFLGDVEMIITPPTEAERRSLAMFTDQSALAEHYPRLVMHFTDKTFEEIKNAAGTSMGTGGAQSPRAREAFRDIQSLMRTKVHNNIELRTLADLYAPERPGFFMAFPGGGRFDRLAYVVDPLGIPDVAPEEVALFNFSEGEGGIWAAFHLVDEYQTGKATSAEDRRLYDITRHEIGMTIRPTRMIGSDRVTLRALAGGFRVVPFNLFKTLRVSRVVDDQGQPLAFVQEDKDQDADFGVVLRDKVTAGQSITLTIDYQGEDALKDSGGGNFILLPRLTWYPNNAAMPFGDRAIFEMTFHYPKDNMLVATGGPAGPEQAEADLKIAKWTSGNIELAVAGFNYGKFRKKDLVDKETGYGIEFYANKEVPDELKDFAIYLDQLSRDKVHITGITGSVSTGSAADIALMDTQNATRIFTAYFGKLPYTRIALTQQPAWNYGQAWPTLIYMPYFAFIDSTQRSQLMGEKGGWDNFWRYVGPHENSHQWWGHTVGWTSYRDQWMSEGFAEFSTSLYVQYVRKDMAKFGDFWEEQRKLITESSTATKGRKPYTIGPITQGYRLNNGKTGPAIARFLIYPKGAYVLHMLRMLMFDHRGGGDAKFREMMKDFVQTYFNKEATTEDFKQIVEKHMTPQMDVDKNGRMDWFFDDWVYGTDVPAYRLDYQVASAGGKPALTVRVTQAGVSANFRTMVPIYADFGKGWTRLGAAKLVGNSSVEIPNIALAEAPKRVTLCALSDVLFTALEVNKR